MAKRKPWPKVGSVIKGDNGSYIKLADNVKIYVEGEEVSLNKSRTLKLESPKQQLESLIKNGLVEEKDVESRRSKVEEISSWLAYNIIAPPPKD